MPTISFYISEEEYHKLLVKYPKKKVSEILRLIVEDNLKVKDFKIVGKIKNVKSRNR